MNILFLDIASTTGFAHGPISSGRPAASGTIRLPKIGGTGAKFGGLMEWLVEFLSGRVGEAWTVVFEAPVGPGMDRFGKTNYQTKYTLTGLCAVAEAACNVTKFPCYQSSSAKIRKSVLGAKPAAGKAKAEVMAHLTAQGFTFRDDNEADAIAGWLHCAKVLREAQPAQGVLTF